MNVFDIEFLSTFLPYRTFDPHTKLFHNDATSGFVLRGRPMVGAHLKDQENLAEFFRRNEYLKEGTSIQFLLVANPKCEHILDWWASSRRGATYEDLARRRARHLCDYSKETPVHLPLVRDYQLFISFTFPEKTKDVVDEERLIEIRDQLQEKIRTIGVPTQVMDAQGFTQSFGEILTLNDAPTTTFPWNRYEDLNKQVCQPNQSFHVTKDGVATEFDYQFRAFVPKNTPSHWSLVFMDKFLGESHAEGLDFPFMIHYGLTICDGQAGEKAKGMAKRESLERSLKSQLSKFMPELKDQYAESLEVVEEIQRKEQLCYAGLSVGIFAKPHKMAKAESRFLAQMNRIGFEFVPTTYNHFPMLLSMLPMTWTYGMSKGSFMPWSRTSEGYGRTLYALKRAKKTITKEAQNMLPILGEWTGQDSPGLPLVGRQGQLFFWNPFGNAFLPNAQNTQTAGNYNVCVAGQSGSGKSVLLQEMANNILAVGGRVFIFDYGRSFDKYCHLLGGQHMTFDLGNQKSLNFFSNLPEGNSSEDIKNRSECLNTISSIVKVMASHTSILGDLASSYVEEAVDFVAQTKGRAGDVNDVRERLLSQKERVARDVGQMLYAYSKEGMYGGFVTGPSTIDLSAKLVVAETDELRNHPSLMSVVVQMVTTCVNQTMLSADRQHPFMFIFDEAWLLLSGLSCADFISNATRTARKYKGSIVLATQLMTDYFNESSPAATAAFNTSTWKIIMNQNSDAIESWKSHPQLQDYASSAGLMNHMKSIHSRPPHYAEIALFSENMKGVVGRLMLDPFSRILYSTNADEFRNVNENLAAGMSIEKAIEAVVNTQARRA